MKAVRQVLLLLQFGLLCGCGPAAEGDAAPRATTPAAAPAPANGTTADGATGWFADVTASSGLDFVHQAGQSASKHLPETMGAGACLADLDGDGDLDAYLVQGGLHVGQRAGVPPDRWPGVTGELRANGPLPANALFANDGAGRFTDTSVHSGAAADPGYGMGVACGDVDNDGDLDLYVTNLADDVLLLNDGTARFVDGTAAWGVKDDRWTGSAAFFDADADGDLDLYVAAYVGVDLDQPLWCGKHEPGWRSYCHPDAYPGLADRFWRNEGTRLVDATQAAGLSTRPGHHGKGLGVICFDADADRDLDIYVANDSVENRLWLNAGDGTFADGTLLSGTGVSGQGLTEAGMGVAAGDVDADGRPDLFVTNFDDESNTLYLNEGAGLFRDGTAHAGLDSPSRLPVGFGTVLADLDDDGDLDAAVANGHIIDNIPLYHDGKTHAQRALLFANDGAGRFTNASTRSGALSAEPVVGRGLYSGDVDGDGDLDLLLTVCAGRARLLANRGGPEGATGSTAVHVDGLPPGTRVAARLSSGRTLWAEAGPQPSYFGQTAPGVHLGLGTDALLGLTLHVPGSDPLSLTLDEPIRKGRLGVFWDSSSGPRLQRLEPGGTMPRPLPLPGTIPR